MRRLTLVAAISVAGLLAPATAHAADGVQGVDVSNWTGDIDWAKVRDGGGRFAFVQASEGVDYRNPRFEGQYGGAAAAGLIRGAYHFAQPHETDGAAQADFFVDNGGAWTSDGQTLPGVLDVEDNPYKDKNGKNNCYDLSPEDMVTWIGDFTRRYRERTKRHAIIYTTTSWWKTCTGDSKKFAKNPLWLARWGAEPGELPSGWKKHSFWQSADKGPLVGGQNSFNGTESQLKALANPPAEVTVTGAAKSRKLYTITLKNTGVHPVTDVRLAGRTFGGQKVVKAGPGCSFSGTAVRCLIPKVNPGHSLRITIATKPSKARGTVGVNVTVGSAKLSLSAR
ncbi:GH25 family lysozyme [Nonomuraea sp. NPDC059194]|uniref:GH25 family lysozyme n=1 Tax=Nonomuraea sp. NPDC059194 TaxID=3346764 RepID=UPI0036C99F98